MMRRTLYSTYSASRLVLCGNNTYTHGFVQQIAFKRNMWDLHVALSVCVCVIVFDRGP